MSIIINSSNAVTINSNSLIFPNILSDFKISLWGPNLYGFGIQGNELKYLSGANHNFYYGSKIHSIDGNGNVTTAGYTNPYNYYCNGILYNYETGSSAWYIDISTIQRLMDYIK